ncbi:MAG: NADH-quinone oxidoreductase subunit L [Pseudomonadota bacterium]|nr:NADH-quinone oxidoreductase subunit L [Pseudomonadota bacterium]
MKSVYLAIPLICLLASIVAGLFGSAIGRRGAHSVTIFGVAAAFVLSLVVYIDVMHGNQFNGAVYTWALSGGVPFQIGFLIDELTATMMVVVTFVSLAVHVYTVGYMAHDEENWLNNSRGGVNSYQRFFSYISLFTFSMLMLVMSNNFLQLFFGWEAVGLVSYLLIGFWFQRESAVFANLKAFLVNRVGDFGFLLGIAAVLYIFGTLDYATVFANAGTLEGNTVTSLFGEWQWASVICLLLFVGAMGKSAQVPLHVWLPDSMEGPTPISALIHAATMVTAGIFMVARMSPLFEFSETALSTVLIIGAITAFFMALIGLVQNDIKRVVAYSTLSQLGYMTVALGASAYQAAIFHLGTHAFFKALLFLAAGSVIIAMHHEQDMRKMGGLRKIMPITFITAVIGSLALAGIPPFAGFFSKDAIIEAVHESEIFGSTLAYYAVLAGVFITAFYSFRLLFMTFYGENRSDEHTRAYLQESPKVVTWPLIALAVPSVLAGAVFFEPMLFGNYFGDSIRVAPAHDVIGAMAEGHHSHGLGLVLSTIWHGFFHPPFWLAVGGIVFAWWCYIKSPELPARIASTFRPLYNMLMNKYGFDDFYQRVFVGGTRQLGEWLWKYVDDGLIDGFFVNGTAKVVNAFSGLMRYLQTGYLYHYAFAMVIGLFVLITWFVWF